MSYRSAALVMLGLSLGACSATPISIPGQPDSGMVQADGMSFVDAGAADAPSWPDASSPDAAGDAASDAGSDGVGDAVSEGAGGDGGDALLPEDASDDAPTSDTTSDTVSDTVGLPPG